MNPNLREDYKKTTDYTANFFHKHPDAVDKFYDKDINVIAKNTGLDRDIVDRDVQRTMKEIRLNTQDTLLEDTKRKGDIGGRATMQEGGSLLLDDREQYAEGTTKSKKETADETAEDMIDMINSRGKYASTLDSKFGRYPYSSKDMKKTLEGVVVASTLLPVATMSKLVLVKKAIQAYKKLDNIKPAKIKKLENAYDKAENVFLAGTTGTAVTTQALEDKIPEDSFLREKEASRKQKAEGGDLHEQMEGMMEEPTHTMPDGTEMAGDTHGEYDEQMESLMDKETPMLPDE